MLGKKLAVLVLIFVAIALLMVTALFYFERSNANNTSAVSGDLVQSHFSVNNTRALSVLKDFGLSRVEVLYLSNMGEEELQTASTKLTADDGTVLAASKITESTENINAIEWRVYVHPEYASKGSELGLNIFLLESLLRISPSGGSALAQKYPELYKTEELGELKLIDLN